ncbi:hypothetical protein LAZ67_3001747 [Cordylochernes scorpioides]|uniref:RNA-directed DNA polymerase n=1 Tax=Cordylochernes scorpioides TaxID=51811 RepID=A0ABY6K809_9ARAC|nr:hypothetical protein LAZ67_3001747 [Cordylochernes scorpioides]
MVETRSGKMQDTSEERLKTEESAKPQPSATIGRDTNADPVVLNPNIDIPKYDGTEDPRPWIESLEEIGFLYHWAEYIISRYAAMNMIGSAKTWLDLHKISFTSWEHFKSRLIQDFGSDANKEELKMRLNRMQQWNEPAIRFAEDILVLCNKVDPQMEEENKINWVIGGLKKEYSFALYLNPPKNTNELLRLCKKMDLFENNYQERIEKSKVLYNGPRSPRSHHQEQWKNAPSTRRPDQNTSKPQAPAPRYYQNTPKPQAPAPRYYQNKPLPQVSAPRRFYTPIPEPKPVYPRKTYNNSPDSNRNRTEDGRPICFKCNKLGHVARYCRVKASIEAEDGEYVIEENNRMTQTNGLRLARSLLTVTDKKTHIWITNPYPRPLKIMKDQTLAYGSLPAGVNFIENKEKQNENDEIQFQINKNLSFKEQERLKQILAKYTDLFSSRLGRTSLAKHQIHTEDAKPIKHKPYRVSAKERTIIKDQIDEMLEEGIIRQSSSPWSFPVILVKKRDGKYRFCVDYRKLNEVTVKDVYPIPRIDDVMDTLQGSKYFSAIDLKSGYWQVEIEERDKEKTAFTTAHGLYEFNVMPFGLCNAPATFERNMDNVLGNLRWQICLCYLDDVIIYSSDFPTHIKRLEAVLRCFSESNLKLNAKECRFAFEELEILGHITNQEGIKPAEYNIKAVRDFPQPKKAKEVQSFLGMCSYYRKCIKDFSLIADPLTSLIRKNVQFIWTGKQEEAFQNLKKALMNPPILGHFDPNAATCIHTDASNIGLGATLIQNIGGEEKVISYLGRTLSKPEQNYSTTEKECVAVVWSISKLRPYLYGRHFKIVTDHHALCWLKNLKDPTGRLARWALKIQEYNFEIIHKSGKKHLDADGLSRGPLPENEWDEDYERLFLNQIIDEKDYFIENIKENLSGNKRSITQNFKEENGCLYKKNPNPEGREWLLVVPKKRRKEIMSEYHNHMLNGHLGVARTTYRLKNKYYWPSMLKDVSEFVKTCHLCQSRKGSNQLPSGLLQPIPPANYPFERIGIDFVGPLPSTKRRRKWIIVLTDYYTKYAETKAVPEATVKEVSTFLIEHIFLRHGAPRFLISDRGSQFTSNLMKEVMKMCKVKHCFTTSYHPQTNGLTERLNRTLINMISMYVNTDQKNWDEILPFITHAYNTTIQETTGYSPFFLLFGREPMSLLDDENIPMDDYDEYIENYLDKIARTRQVVIKNTEKTQERMKRNYDKKHNERIYEPGHLVAVWTPVRKIGKCEKLLREYFGPYRILKKLSNVNYLIEPKDNPGQDPLIVHVSRLKPYFERIDEVTHEDVNALVLDKLTNNLPTLTCPKSNLAHLKTMPLDDPDYNISAPIDILIGAELAMTLFTGESVIGDEELLTATSSELGWLLSGRVSSKSSRRSIRNIIESHHACLETQNIVEKFWKLESIPDVTSISKDENESEIHFVETHGRDSTGRYVVQMPFRNDCHLGESRSNAIKRLCSLERSLIPRPKVYDQYRIFIKEYLELGHMSLVPKEDIIKGRYYLPHHPVIKEKSCTTKLRVVFDASAKTDSALCWINSEPCRCKTFVANRVTKIHRLVSGVWCHVDGRQNPADCASRGIFPSDLIEHPLWWNGPPWLIEPALEIKKCINSSKEEFEEEEKIKTYFGTIECEIPSIVINCSSLTKLKCIIAWCLRFVNNSRMPSHSRNREPLTLRELNDALLTVVNTRAIHLELISSLTTDALISTIRRFIARRGKPATIHSDNATNFVGAHKIIGKLCHNASKVLTNSEGIQWKFIPPSAPHFGGLWEAGVKSMKYHLRRTMGSALLNFEELTTSLAQIEACQNSRPLCPLSEDPEDLQALTPGHFLIGGSLTELPDEDDIIAMSLPNRWQLIQKSMNHFWTRWSQEYVSQLQQRSKW